MRELKLMRTDGERDVTRRGDIVRKLCKSVYSKLNSQVFLAYNRPSFVCSQTHLEGISYAFNVCG